MRSVKIRYSGGDGEREIVRLIQLELEDIGIYADTSDSENDDCAVLISVKEFCRKSDAEKLISEANAYKAVPVLCLREADEVLPAEIVVFERPLEMGRFRESIRKICSSDNSEKTYFDTLTFDHERKTVICGSNEIMLTDKEAILFGLMYDNRGKVVSREKCYRELDGGEDPHIVDVYIRYLRRKIDDRFDRKFIYTVRGSGYMLK